MTIYKELLDYTASSSDLADRAANRLDLKSLQHLCKLFRLSLYGLKSKVAKRVVDHIVEFLHPRFLEFESRAPKEQYDEVLTEVENYLYSKSRDLDDPSPEPLIFTQIPEIRETQEDETEDNETSLPSSTLVDTYYQFALLYLLEQLEGQHRPNINGFKNYLIKEASIIRPSREIIEGVYNQLVKTLKTYVTLEEKRRYLQSLLPSISRSASPSRSRSSSPAKINIDINTDIDNTVTVTEDIDQDNEKVLSLETHIYHFLLQSYEQGSLINIQKLKTYLNQHNVTGYTNDVISHTYQQIQEQLKPYKFDKEKKIAMIESFLRGKSIEEDIKTVDRIQEEDITNIVPLVEFEDNSIQEKNSLDSIQEENSLELPPSDLETQVEVPEVCNVIEHHNTLEELADDLSCSNSKVCDVDRQVCVEATPEVQVLNLQIGDKTVPITGKSDSDIVRDIKKEIVTLTAQLQKKERSEREQLLDVKKFISTPVDLDKLYSSLRSYQSSQQLYSQRKIQQANHELRDKIKKCLFV